MAKLRFVVLRHELPQSATRGSVHWDLMLEHEGALRTWALQAEPASGIEIPAEALPDHRLDYLQYEGPISGNRGKVSRWDEGVYELHQDAPDQLTFTLQGRRLTGTATCRRNPDATGQWTFRLAKQTE